jgi:hypothetical protein
MKPKSAVATPSSQKVEATPRGSLEKCLLRSAGQIVPGAAHPLFGDVASPLLFACAACYGKSDAPLAVAMNWGIFTLLGVVLTVLTGALLFFVHIVRKEEAASQDAPPENPPQT